MAALSSRTFALFAVLLVSWAMTVAGAAAQEPSTLPPRPDPRSVAKPTQTRIRVSKVAIHGAKQLGAGRIASIIGTRASSRLPWGRKRYFDRAVFDADVHRIEMYYGDRGYPDAKVTSFEAKLNDRQDAIAIDITVMEGQPLRVAHVTLQGFETLRPRALRTLQEQLPLQPDAPVDRAQVTATTTMATRYLQDRGFPLALVSTDQTMLPDKRVGLTLTASPGMEARFGAIGVTGNLSVGDDVVRRTLAFKPGTPFSLATMQLSQRRLYDLGLFQLATVTPKTEQVSEGIVPVQITVAEAKHRQIKLSAGYGSEEKARGEAEWKHVNFWGGARTATVEGKWSSLDRGVRTSFKQPYLFSPRVSLTFSGQGWLTDEPAFRLNTSGGRATINYELSHRNVVSNRGGDTTVSASFIGEREDYAITPDFLKDLSVRSQLIALGLDAQKGDGHGLLGAIAIDLRRSTAGSVLDARRGYSVQAHIERAGGWLPGDFTYQEYTFEARHYLTLGRLGVLATRGRAGTIDGIISDEKDSVPFFKRYFLGGSNSLRGWGRFEVSDLSASGLPIGGRSMLEMSAEVRTPLFGKITGVAFVDAGSVEFRPWDIGFQALRYDVGPGVRYLTPIGPLRVDMGFQLNPIQGLLVDGTPQSHPWRIHFSIGQAF